MTAEEQYQRANVEVEQKKAAFRSSATSVKARLSPARLKQDAKHKMSDGLHKIGSTAVVQVTERPVATGAAVGALAIYLFRRPLSALFQRIYVRVTNRTPDQSEKDDG